MTMFQKFHLHDSRLTERDLIFKKYGDLWLWLMKLFSQILKVHSCI